jgi:hypothetical protein
MASKIIITAVLFTMSISTGLILPLLIPNPSYIALYLLVLSLTVINMTGRRISSIGNPMQISLIAIFVLFSLMSFTLKQGEVSIFSMVQGLILNCLIILVLLFAKRKELANLLKVYIIFCVIMAACGIIAWVVINFDFVDLNDSIWSLTEATSGRARRDEDQAGYSFPFGLGLVLTGSYQYDVFSLIMYRGSGWVHEPTTATLFVAPAIIILAREEVFCKFTQRLCFLLLLVFWGTCAAVGSVIAFIGLIVLHAVCTKGNVIKIAISLLVGIFLYLFFLFDLFQLFQSSSSEISLINSKLNDEGFLVVLNSLVSPSSFSQWVVILVMFAIFFITGYYFFRSINSVNVPATTFILVLAYIFIHSLKGSWGHVYSSFFVLAFYVFFFRVFYSNWNLIDYKQSYIDSYRH